MDILNIKMKKNDAGAKTIGDYFARLAIAVWKEGEGFSGKRPFGNSDWHHDVSIALVQAGAVTGEITDGYLEDWDYKAGDNLIAAALKSRLSAPPIDDQR